MDFNQPLETLAAEGGCLSVTASVWPRFGFLESSKTEDNDEGTRWREFESFVAPKRSKLEIVDINCDTVLSLFGEDKAKPKNLK
jgi:hypothetical protein